MAKQPEPVKGPNGEKAKKDTASFVASYDPTKSKFPLVTKEEWLVIGDFVRLAVAPLTWMAAISIRPYLNAVTKLAVWASRNYLPLDMEYLLLPDVIEAFEVSQEQGVASVGAQLARLGVENNVQAEANAQSSGTARANYQEPYSTDEMVSLVNFARAHSNEYRRRVLLGIIGLGAGAGVVRSRMRGVVASDIHAHDDGASYVRTSTNCARIDNDYLDVLKEACDISGPGQLIGDVTGDDLTNHAVAWVYGRAGVPSLNIDRLRATYLVKLIDTDTPLRQLLAWSGLATAEALGGYLAYATKLNASCEGLAN